MLKKEMMGLVTMTMMNGGRDGNVCQVLVKDSALRDLDCGGMEFCNDLERNQSILH